MQPYIGHRGLRLWLSLLVPVVLLLAGCGGGGGDRVTDGVGKGKGKGNSVPTVSVVQTAQGWDVFISGKQLAIAQLNFAATPSESHVLGNTGGVVRSRNTDQLSGIQMLSKGGDYWYFDNAGVHIPAEPGGDDRGVSGLGSLTKVVDPVLGLACPAKLALQQTQPFCGVAGTSIVQQLAGVQLFYAGGGRECIRLAGRTAKFQAQSTDTVAYVAICLRDGSKWFFDRSGTWLPMGYKPQIKVAVRLPVAGEETLSTSRTTSALSLGAVVQVTSSDLYSQVKVGLANDEVRTFTTAEFAGEYDTESTAGVDAIQVTLAADGSKWYFDSAGNMLPADSKWYTDLD